MLCIAMTILYYSLNSLQTFTSLILSHKLGGVLDSLMQDGDVKKKLMIEKA